MQVLIGNNNSILFIFINNSLLGEQIELLLEKGCLPERESLVLAEKRGPEVMNLILRSASKYTKLNCMFSLFFFYPISLSLIYPPTIDLTNDCKLESFALELVADSLFQSETMLKWKDVQDMKYVCPSNRLYTMP